MKLENWSRRAKIQHLRTILAVADNPSLLEASKELGLTQPAVTKIIREVEKSLGVELFIRTSRGTQPTEFGLLLTKHARLIFSQLDRAVEEIVDVKEGARGRVTVGALIAGSASILPRAVARIHREKPGIRITVIEGTYDFLIPMLTRNDLDFIVGRLPSYRYRRDVEVEALYQEEVALVVRPGHPALALEKPTLPQLLDWPWILPLPDTTLRQQIEAAFHDLGLDLPASPCDSISVVTNRSLVLEEDFICAFPWRVVRVEVQAGMLQRLNLSSALSFGPVGISRHKGVALSRAAESLIDAIRLAGKEESQAAGPFSGPAERDRKSR
ncbi:LysR substrate-binding domain-containing protein [Telmatospirillum sp. J64-1]|uniref:LysR substrate-binding domain-containing protein n=1 Tax=Telmatospirillum sp. J64-1 TaxID=2502183 RepID=UPI001C8F4162|nr:LysR substrate-binding domain-containing protein [Telmatospirillum sp. J64-1]